MNEFETQTHQESPTAPFDINAYKTARHWTLRLFDLLLGEAIHIEQSCCADSMEVSRLDMNGNNSYLEHVEMWIEDISNQARLAIKGQITACLHPYRFKGDEYLAFDLDGAEGSFSLTFMAGQPYELNDITPWVPDMSEALAMAAAVALRLDALVKFSPGLRVESDATGSDEQEIRSEWECRFAEPEDIPAAALEYLLTTGGDAQEMRSEDQANLEQLAADQADDPRRKLAKENHGMDADQLLLGLLRGLRK